MVLEIPAKAKRTSSLVGRKCRVEYALVKYIYASHNRTEIISDSSKYGGINILYKIDEIVKPDKYYNGIRTECSNGIHCFITKQEALDY